MGGRVIPGDCIASMAAMPPNSVHSVVTDPPYHLTSITKRLGKPGSAPIVHGRDGAHARIAAGFMGKQWDGGDIAFRVETWQAVWRVLKPGGALVAFGGTRTFHRMAVAIEDAGFEIRDTLMWLYGSGFPKSHNQHGEWNGWGTGLKPAHEMIALAYKTVNRDDEWFTLGHIIRDLWETLWLTLPANAAAEHSTLSPAACGAEMSVSAQWSADHARNIREDLCGQMDMSQFVSATISALSIVSSWNAILAELSTHENTSTTAMGSRTIIDLKILKSLALRITPESILNLEIHRAGQSSDADGATRAFSEMLKRLLGILELSALESAIATAQHPYREKTDVLNEPIILARKPLAATVAVNLSLHRCGALNVDGCRVRTDERWTRQGNETGGKTLNAFGDGINNSGRSGSHAAGRWPANVLHDGSPEVLAAFEMFHDTGAAAPVKGSEVSATVKNAYNGRARVPGKFHGDTGSVARFYYAAKATKADRQGSKHPTVKPMRLMRWLVRLVTPPGGVVLDPFAGSGSTLQAAVEEGFSAIGCEREPEYVADCERRLAAAKARQETTGRWKARKPKQPRQDLFTQEETRT